MYEEEMQNDNNVEKNSTEQVTEAPMENPMHIQADDNENRYFDRMDTPTYATYRSDKNDWKNQEQEKAAPVKKKGGFVRKAVAVVGCGLFFGAFTGIGFYGVCRVTGLWDRMEKTIHVVEEADKKNTGITSVPAGTGEVKTAERLSYTNDNADVSDVVDRVMPAMVSIVNNGTEEIQNFWGQRYTREIASSGTGIIIGENDSELLIATNHHVAESASTLEVTFVDGSTSEAKIKGMDADMDLAVVAVAKADVKDETKNEIAIANLGDSEDLKLGKPVIVIGNALGYGQSVTNGIISGLNRELEMEDGSTGTFIQTNAAVNPGNSGGALLNIEGEVIGIVSSKIGGSTVEGMGYAIPISSASPIFRDMMERQTRGDKVDTEKMGYLGVYLQEITAEARQYYNMPSGVFVYEVTEGSAAEKAGIKKGDIITKLEGEKISSYEELQSVLQYYAAGETVQVVVSRQQDGEYKSSEISVVLGEKPEENE